MLVGMCKKPLDCKMRTRTRCVGELLSDDTLTHRWNGQNILTYGRYEEYPEETTDSIYGQRDVARIAVSQFGLKRGLSERLSRNPCSDALGYGSETELQTAWLTYPSRRHICCCNLAGIRSTSEAQRSSKYRDQEILGGRSKRFCVVDHSSKSYFKLVSKQAKRTVVSKRNKVKNLQSLAFEVMLKALPQEQTCWCEARLIRCSASVAWHATCREVPSAACEYLPGCVSHPELR